jgi:hypothetical protein
MKFLRIEGAHVIRRGVRAEGHELTDVRESNCTIVPDCPRAPRKDAIVGDIIETCGPKMRSTR